MNKDPDLAAPIRAVQYGGTLFVRNASKRFQQTTKTDNLCVNGT